MMVKEKMQTYEFQAASIGYGSEIDIKRVSFLIYGFACSVLIREITVFQCQLCSVAVETTLIELYYLFLSLSPFYYSEIASCLNHGP
jgi:hypothetical protein